jgi:hypothetical protein
VKSNFGLSAYIDRRRKCKITDEDRKCILQPSMCVRHLILPTKMSPMSPMSRILIGYRKKRSEYDDSDSFTGFWVLVSDRLSDSQ